LTQYCWEKSIPSRGTTLPREVERLRFFTATIFSSLQTDPEVSCSDFSVQRLKRKR
jgi:hypothetical protein